VNPSSDAVDLLTLIGKTIGRLRQSIEHFEDADKGNGLSCLSAVITDIDAYLERIADDPLVPLAHVEPARLRESLHHVQDDLSVVIDQIQRRPAS
jgi:hypothetical protein